MIEKPRIFISHIADEALLADIIKRHLSRDFLGLIDLFVSSDATSIDAGINWLEAIDTALKSAIIEIILCSNASIKRPWINFEAGAGWIRSIPVIPVCHTGLQPADLPMPLTVLQAVEAGHELGMTKLYRIIAKRIGADIPRVDFNDMIDDIKSFETNYAQRMKPLTSDDNQKNQNALARMKEALRDERFKSRSVKRLAIIAGVSESEALDILRNDSDVVFDASKDFGRVAKLRSRF